MLQKVGIVIGELIIIDLCMIAVDAVVHKGLDNYNQGLVAVNR